ncbi:MAG: YchJ family protein [Halomonadaceae bacterium]|uniref:SEC-C domain-containing protein n=1 Tax=Halomonas colorata TaxID=2742615 RepID=A0ABR9FTN1_9GAMM|nr:YchJ family metal-binding protein [Halomonas colorata]MBE0462011.1 SEC-C domain-containing protein [Halomonas colorata]
MISLTEKSCPCGTGLSTDLCCARYHNGELAPTPEALMRSRYSAFALNLCDYLLATWHVSTRPVDLSPDPYTQWKGLSIIKKVPDFKEGPSQADVGYIQFFAYFKERARWHRLEENSRFVFEQSRWWYMDGTPKVMRLKPRRNDSCFCGSGRKLKLCCKE